MPTNRKRRGRTQTTLDYWKIDQLITGEFLLSGVGYASVCPTGCNGWTDTDWQAVRAAAEADWHRHGNEILVWWRGDSERFTPLYSAMHAKLPDRSRALWAQVEFGEPQQ